MRFIGLRHFSLREIRDIAISVVVLCAIFSYPEFLANPPFLIVSLLVVGVAFMGHELSHKFMAIREVFQAEYRMWPQGLGIAVLLAFATRGMFVFAAPGAVYFQSNWFFGGPVKPQLTKISMAGITFNIALMWLSLLLYAASGFALLAYMASINGWLAIFNLLPFGTLDGDKLFKLEKRVWVVLFAAAASGFVLAQFA